MPIQKTKTKQQTNKPNQTKTNKQTLTCLRLFLCFIPFPFQLWLETTFGNAVCQNVTGHNVGSVMEVDDCSLNMFGVNGSKVIIPSQPELAGADRNQLLFRLYTPKIGLCSNHGNYVALHISCVKGRREKCDVLNQN